MLPSFRIALIYGPVSCTCLCQDLAFDQSSKVWVLSVYWVVSAMAEKSGDQMRTFSKACMMAVVSVGLRCSWEMIFWARMWVVSVWAVSLVSDSKFLSQALPVSRRRPVESDSR